MATTPEGRTSERFGEQESDAEFPTIQAPPPQRRRSLSSPRRRQSCPAIPPTYRRSVTSRGHRTPRTRSPVRDQHHSRPSQRLDQWEGGGIVGTPHPLSLGRNLSDTSLDTVEDQSIGGSVYRSRSMTMPMERHELDPVKLEERLGEIRGRRKKEVEDMAELDVSQTVLDAYKYQLNKYEGQIKGLKQEKGAARQKYSKLKEDFSKELLTLEKEHSREKMNLNNSYQRKLKKLKDENDQKSAELAELRHRLAEMELEKRTKLELQSELVAQLEKAAKMAAKREMEAEERAAQERKKEQSRRNRRGSGSSSSCLFGMDWSRVMCGAGGDDADS